MHFQILLSYLPAYFGVGYSLCIYPWSTEKKKIPSLANYEPTLIDSWKDP